MATLLNLQNDSQRSSTKRQIISAASRTSEMPLFSLPLTESIKKTAMEVSPKYCDQFNLT